MLLIIIGALKTYCVSTVINRHTGLITWGARVNPNKYLYGDSGYIENYSVFLQVLNEMLASRGVSNCKIQRADFRIDNYTNTFSELYKLNNIVVNILSLLLGIKNYKSIEGIAPHNTVSRGNKVEVECYDRIIKEGRGLTKTRVELRRKFPFDEAITSDRLPDIGKEWIGKLSNRLLSLYYAQFQRTQNQIIIEDWHNGQQKNTSRNIIGLLAKYKDYIYTSRQMRDLCEMLGLSRSVNYTYKNRLQIDYYTYKDIEAYTKKIIDVLNVFLTS